MRNMWGTSMSSELRSRLKGNWLSFVHRLEFTSEGRSQSPFIDIFTSFTHCFTCRYTEAEAQCRMEEKKYVKVSTYGCILIILITFHNFSCSFWFKLQCMHACKFNSSSWLHCIKYSVFNNDRRPVIEFSNLYFWQVSLSSDLLLRVKEYTM